MDHAAVSIAADALAGVRLFAGLTDDDRAALAAAMELRCYADGDAVMVQNDRGDGLHIVSSGIVRVGRRLPGGGFADTARLAAGSLVGEMALVGRGGERHATVLADGPVATLFLPAQVFRAALAQLRPDSLAMQRALGTELASRVLAKTGDIAATLAALPNSFTPRRAPRQRCAAAEAGFDPSGFIAKMPFGAALEAQQRAALLASGRIQQVASGARLERSRVWLIARGALRSDLPLPGGDFQIEVLGPGRLAGVAMLLAGSATGGALTATEASLLVGWEDATLRGLLARDDALAMALGALINADLVTSLDALDGVEARIAAMQRAAASEV